MTRLTIKWASELLAGFSPPSELGLAPLAGEVDYASVFLLLVRGSTRLAALGLLLGVWLAALAPIWHWRRLATISKLSPAQRATLLAELLRHPWFAVRELTLLLKLGASLALLGSKSVRARSGYDNVQARAKTESGLQRRLPVAAGAERSVS